MNILRLIQSFKDAMRGVAYVFNHEQNFRIQTAVGILVMVAAWYFELGKQEWVLVLLLILLVMTLEFLNSAVEKFTDVLKPRLDVQMGNVKDIMAGVVFLASLCALVIGIIIFYPRIVVFLK